VPKAATSSSRNATAPSSSRKRNRNTSNDSTSPVLDLTADHEQPTRPRPHSDNHPRSNPSKKNSTVISTSTPNRTGAWTCPTCTLLNEPLHLQCMACESVRPPTSDSLTGTTGSSVRIQVAEGWICLRCGEEGIDHQFWSCRSCGWIKVDSSG
jgi:ribosomal protein L37E